MKAVFIALVRTAERQTSMTLQCKLRLDSLPEVDGLSALRRHVYV